MDYRVISIKEREEWSKNINKCKTFVFYHTWYYHSLDKSGEPFLFIYEEKESLIVFPLIRRVIEGSNLFNCTSVYGYAGPTSSVNLSLFQFKSGLSDQFLNFKTWRYISDLSTYNILISKCPLESGPNFFPLYRILALSNIN